MMQTLSTVLVVLATVAVVHGVPEEPKSIERGTEIVTFSAGMDHVLTRCWQAQNSVQTNILICA